MADYTVLARKWRPQGFGEVVGQDVVVRTLRNALEKNRVAHAYLFAGSRGTGKTTVARILARALNCKKGPTPEPCGACGPCTEILRGASLDVLEIDGASTRGIDDVRQLRENVRLVPSGGGKKVYIIDEVHMLTAQAFNALLKTLEEPPPHVVFVLATTDAQKLPETILSRCQRFNFARIAVRDAVERLKEVVSGEDIRLTDEALMLLARRSGGALRDALGFLDQIISTGTETVDAKAVADTLGIVGTDVVTDIVRATVEKDPGRALELVWEVQRGGYDLEFLLEGILDLLRNLLVVKTSSRKASSLDVSEEERGALDAFANELELGDVLRLIRIAVGIGTEVRVSDHPWVHVEVGLVEMASLDRVEDIGQLLELLRGERGAAPPPGGGKDTPGSGEKSPGGSKSRKTTGGEQTRLLRERPEPSRAAPRTPPPALPPSARAGAASLEPLPAPVPSDAGEAHSDLWASFLGRMRDEKPLLWGILTQGELGAFGEGVVRFHLDPKNDFHVEQLKEPAHIETIERYLHMVYDTPLRFEVTLLDGAGADASGATTGGAGSRKVMEDPFVKRLLEFLDGEIVS